MKKTTTPTRLLAACIFVIALTSCAMFDGNETPGEYIDDSTITSKIKTNILGDEKLKVLQINVETMLGVVQLSGFVDSLQSETRAVEVTRNVRGVKSVEDDLIIR